MNHLNQQYMAGLPLLILTNWPLWHTGSKSNHLLLRIKPEILHQNLLTCHSPCVKDVFSMTTGYQKDTENVISKALFLVFFRCISVMHTISKMVQANHKMEFLTSNGPIIIMQALHKDSFGLFNEYRALFYQTPQGCQT